jgi:uncharacterized protein YfaS (alpha-2-macroglobulin family)
MPAYVLISFLLAPIGVVVVIAGGNIQCAFAASSTNKVIAKDNKAQCLAEQGSAQIRETQIAPYTIEVFTGRVQDEQKSQIAKESATNAKGATKQPINARLKTLNERKTKHTLMGSSPLKLITTLVSAVPDNSGYRPAGTPISWVSCSFDFSNPLEDAANKTSMVDVTPKVDHLEVMKAGSKLYISGSFQPKSRYKVVFNKKLTDIYGHQLGPGVSASLITDPLNPEVEQNDFECRAPDEELKHEVWVHGVPSVHISIRKVQAEDWLPYQSNETDPKTLGVLVSENDYPIGVNGQRIEIDLKPYAQNKFGHFLILVDPLGNNAYYKHRQDAWFEITNIAIDAYDSGKIEFLASSLSDGKPLVGVKIKSSTIDAVALTDSNGRAIVEYKKAPLISNWIATIGQDSCVLSGHFSPGRSFHSGEGCEWYAVSDRNIYEPGERATIKGWLRQTCYSPKGGIKLASPGNQNLQYELVTHDKMNTPVLTGSTTTDTHGAFSFEVSLPNDLHLGKAVLCIWWPINESEVDKMGAQAHQNIATRNRQPAEISLDIRGTKSSAPCLDVISTNGSEFMVGQDAVISAKASNINGQPMSDATVRWTIHPHAVLFSPPGWRGFRFNDTNYDDIPKFDSAYGPLKELIVKSDSSGRSAVRIAFNSSQIERPTLYRCEASTIEENQQKNSSACEIMVHPADTYVGIKMRPLATSEGGQIDVSVIATDVQGKINSGTQVELEFTETFCSDVCSTVHRVVTVGKQPAQVIYKPNKLSTIVSCLAVVRDANGRKEQCKIEFSPHEDLCTSLDDCKYTDNHTAKMTLAADKTEYQAGESALVELKTPFPNSKGTLFIVKDTIVSEIPLNLEGQTTVLKIPITEDFYPTVFLKAYLAHGHEIGAEGELKLSVPPLSRRLNLHACSRAPYTQPGKESTIDISVKDWDGKAVAGCQVLIGIVDEELWTVSNYKLSDPVARFYPDIWSGSFPTMVSCSHSRSGMVSHTFTDFNWAIVGPKVGEPRGMSKWPNRSDPNKTLMNRCTTVTGFLPIAETDTKGDAHVTFSLPAHVTRYHAIGIAASVDKFGIVEFSSDAPAE